MRVLFSIHHALDANAGAPGVTVQLAAALTTLGHEAEIFSWDDLPAGLGARAAEALFPEFAARRFARAARDGFDVIDASTGDAWVWSLAQRRRSRRPLLVTRTHGLEHSFRDARVAQAAADHETIPRLERLYHGGVRLREVALSLRRSDAALFLNRADRDRAVAELGVAPARAHLVANGVPDAFIGLPAPGPVPPGDAVRVAQVGSWDPRKGVRDAVGALDAVLRDHADVTATFLGTGVAPEVVRAEFDAAVRERVRVLERYDRAELPGVLREHAILLQPSLAEGFSLALIEGMACGLAPIATRVGAAPDVLTDGETGLLVEPRDPAGLATALRRLLDDRGRLARIRSAAHATAQRYAWSRVAADAVALYGACGRS